MTVTEVTPIEWQKSKLRSSFLALLTNFMENLKEQILKKEETPKKERETTKKIIEIEKRRGNKEAARKVEVIAGRNEDEAMMPRMQGI